MIDALEIYLDHAARTNDHDASVVLAAESLVDRPWAVLDVAGRLARCELAIAEHDLGLTRQLEVTGVSGEGAVVAVAAGQPYPAPTDLERRRRGVFDPPLELARRVVRATIEAVDGPVETALDLACGTGAFLLAAVEAGVPEVYGTDLHELSLRVAALAVPRARLLREDPLKHGPGVDIVVGAPPFVRPGHIDARLRWELQRRYPWLGGRFDLVIPHAAAAVERTRTGGATGLVLPRPVLVKPYGARVRRRWLERHRVRHLSGPHVAGSSSTQAMVLVLGANQPPGPLPVFGLSPEELLRLDSAPMNPDLRPGDIDLVRRIRGASVPLGSVSAVRSGLVVEGPEGGGRTQLVFPQPGDDRVPLADAHQFFVGERSWLTYDQRSLHKPMHPDDFAPLKVVVQRLREKGPIRAGLDADGVFVDHTCTFITSDHLAPKQVLDLVRSPLTDAVTRVEHGDRFDLYPRELSQFPVPMALLGDPTLSLRDAWGLTEAEEHRLKELARS